MSLLKYGWIYILLALFLSYVQSEIEFNAATTGIGFIFIAKERRQVLQKEQDQQLSLTDSVLCFNSDLLLSTIIKFSNQSPFLFHSPIYDVFIVLN